MKHRINTNKAVRHLDLAGLYLQGLPDDRKLDSAYDNIIDAIRNINDYLNETTSANRHSDKTA